MRMFEGIEFGDKYVTADGEMMVFVYFFEDYLVFIDSKGNKYEYLSDGNCITQKIERFDGASIFLSEEDKILKTIVGRYYVQSPGESLGNHLRNILGPLQTLIDVVEEWNKNPDDEVSKKMLKTLIRQGLQGYMDKIVEFSKIDKMESEVWRYY